MTAVAGQMTATARPGRRVPKRQHPRTELYHAQRRRIPHGFNLSWPGSVLKCSQYKDSLASDDLELKKLTADPPVTQNTAGGRLNDDDESTGLVGLVRYLHSLPPAGRAL